MTVNDILLIQKSDEGSVVKDTFHDFGFVTGELPYLAKSEFKDLAVRDCPGEDGERVFFPKELPLKAYDISFDLLCYEREVKAYARYKALRDYLAGYDGTGTCMKVYSPTQCIGRKEVYVKSLGEPEYFIDNTGEYLKIPVTFHFADPRTDITLANPYDD